MAIPTHAHSIGPQYYARLSTNPILNDAVDAAMIELSRAPSRSAIAPEGKSLMILDVERRLKPRIDLAFPAKVHGVDANGESFEIETTLDNFSAGGLYLRLARRVHPGTQLQILVRLPTASDHAGTWQIATDGVVLRAAEQQNGGCGVAVQFTKHRFL